MEEEYRSLKESSKLTNSEYKNAINYLKTMSTGKIDEGVKENLKFNIKLTTDNILLRFGLCFFKIQSDCPKRVCPFDIRAKINRDGFLDKYTFSLEKQIDYFGSYEDNIKIHNETQALISMIETKKDNKEKGIFRCMFYCDLYKKIAYKFHLSNESLNSYFSDNTRTDLVNFSIKTLKDFRTKV